MRVEGLSYDTYVLWCAECGAIIGPLWHTEMLRHFAERTVDMVLDGLVDSMDATHDGPSKA